MRNHNITILLLFCTCLVANAQNTWSSIAALSGFHSYNSVAFSVNGKGYVGTGTTNGQSGGGTQFWEYDPSSNSWSQKADFAGVGRAGAFGFGIGNFGYIGGGAHVNLGQNHTDFYQYNPANNTWSQKSSHPGVSRQGSVYFSMNGKGYMGLGIGFPWPSDFHEYDPITDTWTSKSNFPGPVRERAAGFAICGKGYVGGGDFSAPINNDFYEFDPVTNTWTQKSNIPGNGYRDVEGFGICDKGYITYTNNFNGANEMYEYSVPTDSWQQKAGFPGSNRTSTIVFTIADKAYVGLGGGSSTLQDIYAYTPSPGNVPSQPSTISGNTSPCAGSIETYSITPVTCAESYTWTFPSGTTINSGTGTNSVSVTWGSTPGTISVTADNPCGSSTPRTAAVTLLSAPATPGSITGTLNVCSGTAYTYSISTVTGATSYVWTLPSGWTGNSTTSSISATAGTTGGQIQVTASNSCGASNPSNLTVNVVAQTIQLTSSAATSQQTVCAASPITPIVYSVGGSGTGATITGLPTGITGSFASGNFTISGQSNTAGTHTYIVTTTGTCTAVTASGTIIVQASTPAQPSSISGSQTVCAGTNPVFSVTQDPNANSYTWALPSGWNGTSSINSINPTVGTTGGIITVSAINACGTSPSQSIDVTITPFDLTVSTIGNSLQANQAGASYQWINCATGNSAISGANAQLYTPSSTGTYAVIITFGTCSDTTACIAFTVTGVSKLEATNMNISIWPSIASDILFIKIDKNSMILMEIEIIDSQGKSYLCTLTQSDNLNEYKVNLPTISPGVYVVRMRVDDNIAYGRFIKE